MLTSLDVLQSYQPLIDLRDSVAFVKGHYVGATHIPWHQLPQRLNELPPKSTTLYLMGLEGVLNEAVLFLAEKGYQAKALPHLNPLEDAKIYPGLVVFDEHSRSLWRPSPLVAEFIEILTDRPIELGGLLAIDLGCGGGRDAVFLAQQGLQVTGIEHKPAVLSRAQQLSYHSNVFVNWLLTDLREAENCFTPSSWDVMIMVRYLNRDLFPKIKRAIRPGGWIVIQTFTEGCEAFGSPKNPNFILRTQELRKVFSDFTIIIDRIDRIEDGRPVASFIAQKKGFDHARNDSDATV